MKKSQKEEIKQAAREGRQPVCVHCKQTLDRVEQKQNRYNQWTWNEDKKRYVWLEEFYDNNEEPRHVDCKVGDKELIAEDEAHEKLGLCL